jgi:hypothetical protein
MRFVLASIAGALIGCTSSSKTVAEQPQTSEAREPIRADARTAVDGAPCGRIRSGDHKPTHRELMRCAFLSPSRDQSRQKASLEAYRRSRLTQSKPRPHQPGVTSLLQERSCPGSAET